MLDWLWNMVFPPRCPNCHRYVEQEGSWCPDCLNRLCRPHRLSLDAEMNELFAGAWALGVYEGSLRNMLRQLKYQKKQSVLPYLHSFAAEGMKRLAEKDSLILPSVTKGISAVGTMPIFAVPVPLHANRLKKRGFNQSQLIFQEPLADCGVQMQDWLQRTVDTVPQFGLDAGQRKKNLRQAFSLREAADVQDKQIILVDDIMTTGATLKECGQVLKMAGAGRLIGIVAASGHR